MTKTEITDDWLSGVEAEARVEMRSGRHSATLAPCDVLALIREVRHLRAVAARFDREDGVDGAACAAIRETLAGIGAPPAAFIDDAVMAGLSHVRRKALEDASRVAYQVCAENREMKLGAKVSDAINASSGGANG